MSKNSKIDWQQVDELFDETVEMQKKKLLHLARRLVPGVTAEDILQPNDFPELENHPDFRYEEGMLSGMLTIQMALRALRNDSRF